MATSKSDYLLTPCQAKCPNDRPENFSHEVELLMLDSNSTSHPAFFICFTCRFIGQLGVGPVGRVVGN